MTVHSRSCCSYWKWSVIQSCHCMTCACTRCHGTMANPSLLGWPFLMSHVRNSPIRMFLISSCVPSQSKPLPSKWSVFICFTLWLQLSSLSLLIAVVACLTVVWDSRIFFSILLCFRRSLFQPVTCIIIGKIRSLLATIRKRGHWAHIHYKWHCAAPHLHLSEDARPHFCKFVGPGIDHISLSHVYHN